MARKSPSFELLLWAGSKPRSSAVAIASKPSIASRLDEPSARSRENIEQPPGASRGLSGAFGGKTVARRSNRPLQFYPYGFFGCERRCASREMNNPGPTHSLEFEQIAGEGPAEADTRRRQKNPQYPPASMAWIRAGRRNCCQYGYPFRLIILALFNSRIKMAVIY
jgi:hypothetical protein